MGKFKVEVSGRNQSTGQIAHVELSDERIGEVDAADVEKAVSAVLSAIEKAKVNGYV